MSHLLIGYAGSAQNMVSVLEEIKDGNFFLKLLSINLILSLGGHRSCVFSHLVWICGA